MNPAAARWFRRIRRLALSVSWATLCLGPWVGAQKPAPDTVSNLPGIEVQTSIDRAEALIGDLVTYKLIITYDSTYELVPPPLGLNLGAFDVKDYQSDVLTRLPDGRMQSENTFVLSTFTTGEYRIPPIPLTFNLPDGSRKVVVSETVPITVKSLIEGSSDTLDIKPLRGPYVFERDLTRYYLLGAALVLVLGGLGFWIWRRRRRGGEALEPEDTRDPWEIAFESLAVLQQRKLIAEGRFRDYYFELTEIARRYLARMYLRHVLEMTTDEFVESFQDVPLPGDLYDRMCDFLHHADLVKFAKHVPEIVRAESDLSLVHDAVERIRADFERQRSPQSPHDREPQAAEVGA